MEMIYKNKFDCETALIRVLDTMSAAGIRTLQDGSSLFLSGPLHSNFYLAAVVSADYLPQQVCIKNSLGR